MNKSLWDRIQTTHQELERVNLEEEEETRQKTLDVDSGDIVLFGKAKKRLWTCCSGTRIKYSGCGVVVKDPDFGKVGKGTWLIECNNQNGSLRISCLKERVKAHKGVVSVRRVRYREQLSKNLIMKQMKQAYAFANLNCKKKTTGEWIKAVLVNHSEWYTQEIMRRFKKNPKGRLGARFWSPALTAYVLTKCKVLPNDTPWPMVDLEDISGHKDTLISWNVSYCEPERL